MKTILIASTNKGKVEEISSFLKSPSIDEGTLSSKSPSLDKALELLPQLKIKTLNDYPPITEPEEPFETFIENAIFKAEYYGKEFEEITISDDGGLNIKSLNNFPGVRTKDFMLECGSEQETFKRLESMLKGKSTAAVFHSVIAVYVPKTQEVITSHAKESGHLVFPARIGNPALGRGFGFDPVFVPDGYDKTFSELGLEVKNKISHRAKAIRGILPNLTRIF